MPITPNAALTTWQKHVIYPGLSSHPQHAIFTSLLNQGYGFGGILSIECANRKQAERFMTILQNDEGFGYMAVSLGYYDTLMSCSSCSTSSEIPPEDQVKMGLTEGLVRLSIGYSAACRNASSKSNGRFMQPGCWRKGQCK